MRPLRARRLLYFFSSNDIDALRAIVARLRQGVFHGCEEESREEEGEEEAVSNSPVV
jgi:hypothetical protein